MSDKVFDKLKCPKCGVHMESQYSNEYLQEKFPYIYGDKSFKNLKVINRWFKMKRRVKCPECGFKKKISKKTLMKISKLKHDKEKDK